MGEISRKTENRQDEKGDIYLSSFGLVLDIFRGANLGFDVLEVRQWLVDDAELLGSCCG